MASEFKKAYDRLNDAQKKAVDKIDGPLLVIAGPGTGKTQLLSARVANILQKTDADAENILCLTFTEAGASAMRARLNSFIGPASSKVNISTYHAFGSDIIRLYNNFAERVPRNLDAPIDTVRQHKIVTTLRDKLKHNDILRHAKVSDLISTISEIKTARLTPDDLRKIAEINMKDSAEIGVAVSGFLASVPKGARFPAALPFYEQVRDALVPLVKTGESGIIAGKVERIVASLLDSLNDVIEKQSASEKPSASPLTNWKDRNFEKDADGNFVLNNRVANKKLASMAGLLESYDAYLAEAGLFDFADMIEEAIKYLRDDKAFRLSVQEKYQYVLLDEFQDTNDSQLELIRLIADYEQPNIMAVGDDDQAIYAFQGARYSNLMDFQKQFGAEVVVLTVNYRSGQPVIDLGGSVAGQIAERFATKYDIEKKLDSRASYLGETEEKVQILRHEYTSTPSEYSSVAGQIAELVKKGVPQKEIAIIAPKHKYLEAIVPYLAEHPEVKVSYEKREDILESDKITPLIKLSRMIVSLAKVQPTAPNMLEALSFPFWGVSAIDAINAVHAIKEQRVSAIDYLMGSENPRLVELAEFFSQLALKSLDTPLELMLDYILGTAPLGEFRSPYLDYYAEMGDFNTITFYENLTVLREHILSYFAKDNLRLTDLVDFVDDYTAADQKLVNTSPYIESADAVNLVSAHGAKGLEYEYVFLVSLDNNAWGTSKGNNNTLVLPKNLEFVRHTGATEDEKLRLFFVAITRAKYNLYLSSSRKDFLGKETRPLVYLQEVDGISPLLPEESQEIIIDENERPTLEDLKTNWSGKFHVRQPEIREIALKNVERYRLTASDLTSYINVIYGGPEDFYLKKVLKSPQAYSTNISYGNFMHEVFDRVTREKISDTEAVEYYRELVRKADLEDEDRDEMLEKGVDNLPVYLKARGGFLRDAGHFSEVKFPGENLIVDGVPITGRIDHIAVDEAAKTIQVVDFKTGKYHDKKWDADDRLYVYKMQLMFYKMLLEASRKYRGYRVVSATIDFVTPDEDGEVRQKVLEYSEKEMAEFRKLCGKVYENIKALEFPDISGIDKSLRGMKEFVKGLVG